MKDILSKIENQVERVNIPTKDFDYHSHFKKKSPSLEIKQFPFIDLKDKIQTKISSKGEIIYPEPKMKLVKPSIATIHPRKDTSNDEVFRDYFKKSNTPKEVEIPLEEMYHKQSYNKYKPVPSSNLMKNVQRDFIQKQKSNVCNYPQALTIKPSALKLKSKHSALTQVKNVSVFNESEGNDEHFLFDTFGKEKLEEEASKLRKEREAYDKNKKLEALLVSRKKEKYDDRNDQIDSMSYLNITETRDHNNMHSHINPIRVRNNQEDYYKFLKFTYEEIVEKVLDFEFYKFDNLPNVTMPDTFVSESHYKYTWIINFFREIKSLLLSGKDESNNINTNLDVKVSFTYRGPIVDTNLNFYTLNTNIKVDNIKRRQFKENDLIAFYEDKENFDPKTINIRNTNGINFFLGLISYDKTSDSNELICKVLSSSRIKEENIFYSMKVLSNLTSSIREYNAILEMGHSNFSDVIFDCRKFLAFKSQENVTNIPKVRKYLDNISAHNCILFNTSQREAIEKASLMKTKDIFLIQGPPGTGKTHTIVGIISLFRLKDPNSRILICAPSNTAIDEIAARIAKYGLLNYNLENYKTEFIRFGLYDRLEKENKYLMTDNGKILQRFSVEKLVEEQFMSEYTSISRELDQIDFKIRTIEKEIRQNSLKNTSECNKRLDQLQKDKKDLKNEKHNLILKKQAHNAKRRVYEKELIEKTKIMCTTLNSAGHERLKSYNIEFEYLIIDEACQCVEPSSIIPFYHRVQKVVMVGDHMQLPATVFSDTASITKYNRSLFERLIDNKYPRHVLTIQYRMQSNIREFVGKVFYDEKLKDNIPTINEINSNEFYKLVDIKLNFSFFDLNYGSEKFVRKSFANTSEVSFVIKLLQTIQGLIDECNQVKNVDFFQNKPLQFKYAIITPYKAQVRAIYDEISFQCPSLLGQIEVNTVDSFQGREQEIVIISTVRSNVGNDLSTEEKNMTGIGFLNDYRRMNVALSRAKLACFVVGNAKTLIYNEYWQKLVSHCIDRNTLFPMTKDMTNDSDAISYILKYCEMKNKDSSQKYISMINKKIDSITNKLPSVNRKTFLGKKIQRDQIETIDLN